MDGRNHLSEKLYSFVYLVLSFLLPSFFLFFSFLPFLLSSFVIVEFYKIHLCKWLRIFLSRSLALSFSLTLFLFERKNVPLKACRNVRTNVLSKSLSPSRIEAHACLRNFYEFYRTDNKGHINKITWENWKFFSNQKLNS